MVCAARRQQWESTAAWGKSTWPTECRGWGIVYGQQMAAQGGLLGFRNFWSVACCDKAECTAQARDLGLEWDAGYKKIGQERREPVGN